MEELSKLAMAYYLASPDHLKKLADDFFKAMDHDGDNKIDLQEFLEFMRDEGYAQMTNPSFFRQLDLDKNGTLEFYEVMTVYYIVKSGRPFCDHCKKFITSTYLTCVGCLEGPIGGSFYLCPDCYMDQKHNHAHGGLCQFLDNYSLLEAMTKSKLNEKISLEAKSRPPVSHNNNTWDPSLAMVQIPNRPPTTIVSPQTYHLWSQGGPSAPPIQNHTWNIHNNYSYHYPPPGPVHNAGAPPNAIVPVPQRQQWRLALGALDAALHIGVIGSNLCSIL